MRTLTWRPSSTRRSVGAHIQGRHVVGSLQLNSTLTLRCGIKTVLLVPVLSPYTHS